MNNISWMPKIPWLKIKIQKSYKIILKNHIFISHGNLFQARWSFKSNLPLFIILLVVIMMNSKSIYIYTRNDIGLGLTNNILNDIHIERERDLERKLSPKQKINILGPFALWTKSLHLTTHVSLYRQWSIYLKLYKWSIKIITIVGFTSNWIIKLQQSAL